MRPSRAIAATTVALAIAASATALASSAHADPNSPSSVAAQPRISGVALPNNLSPEWVEHPVSIGAFELENPADYAAFYGYDNNGQFVPGVGSNVEASKTEPDKNTYLVLAGQHGADRRYFYGTHFLFQGHETGLGGYITRVNLDADIAHKVTLIATRDAAGNPLPTFDGSVWDPFANRLLFSAELGSNGGVFSSTTNPGASVQNLYGSIGRAGYEGMQVDAAGNIWLVEDTGGAAAGSNGKGKQPNSFVYRFVPKSPVNLAQGKLQALTILDSSGQPVSINADSPLEAQLHTYGTTFHTKWVTVHDTAVDGTASFDANALAKAAHATPFKRPENGQFRPGDGFRNFYFSETGDTNALSPYDAGMGGFGGLMHLSQASPKADTGTLSITFVGDLAHTGFDNLSFLDHNRVLVVEDAGDTLHQQRNALDSGYIIDVTHDYSDGAQPVRWLGEGRDASATIDAGLAGTPGFQNEGDNEITGIHVSNGNATVTGLIGRFVPSPFVNGWRIFWTQQHGDNYTWEITPKR